MENKIGLSEEEIKSLFKKKPSAFTQFTSVMFALLAFVWSLTIVMVLIKLTVMAWKWVL